MPGPHDLGGRPAGAIDRTEHVPTALEKRIDALQVVLGGSGLRLYRVDELRRAIESLAPEDYFSFGYYERWAKAIETLLIEKGVLDKDEIAARIEALRGGARA